MKTGVVVLVLAVITGCSARAVPPTIDAVHSQWEKTVDGFWNHISELTTKSDEYLKTIKTSQFTTELDRMINDAITELSQVTQSSETTVGQVSDELKLLYSKLQKDMLDAKARSIVYLNEFKSLMEQDNHNARTRMTNYSQKLKKRLNKDAEDIRNTLQTYVGEVNDRAVPHMDTAKSHVHQASDSASKKLEELTSVVQSEVENLGQQLETDAKELKTKLEASAQDLLTAFNKMAKQLASQVETIMEKVNS